MNERVCAKCGSKTTYINNGTPDWANIDGKPWCRSCKKKFFYNKKSNPITNPRRLCFQNKYISLKENPRTGYCNICPNNIYDKSCKITHIHHTNYHNDDPLRDTIEVCPSCHAKITNKKIEIIRVF